MSDLISIITPTFNRAYILGTAIESVLAQTYKDWELVVIDDGSTDDTKAVVTGFHDARIRYVYQENAGQWVARNNGLDLAKGRWHTFLDSDNEFLPACIERCLAFVTANPHIVAVFPKANRVLQLLEQGVVVRSIAQPDDFPQTKDVVRELFMRDFHFDVNAFFLSASIRDEGIRPDPHTIEMVDWDYAMDIAEAHPDGIVYLPEVLYNYYQRYGGDGMVSNTPYKIWALAFEQIYQKHKNSPHMKGQTWYPAKVEKWKKRAADYEKGLVPPPHLYPFQE